MCLAAWREPLTWAWQSECCGSTRAVPWSTMEARDVVEQIWTANAGRQLQLSVACEEPARRWRSILSIIRNAWPAKTKGWTITQVLNTHEHHDHTGGNQQVIAATGAKLFGACQAKDKIPGWIAG